MSNQYYVAAPEVGFQSPAVPVKRTFRKVKDIVKQAIIAANEKFANVDFGDLQVDVDVTARTLSIKLKETIQNNYTISDENNTIVVSYADIDFNEFVRSTLGFKQTYLETDLDAVKAALPEGFSFTYDEPTQVMTVTVNQETNHFTFDADNSSTACVLLQGKSFTINFVDEAIDLSQLLPNRELTIGLEDLLEPINA